MFHLKSDRLILLPLPLEELILLATGRNSLEEALGLHFSSFEFNAAADFEEMFWQAINTYCIPKVTENSDSYVWFTHWLIINSQQNLVIGGIGARGYTDENGENMIGYFIDKKSEKQGFATEAVKCFTNWMFKDPQLKVIIADTLIDGFGSQKVLQKAGFVYDGEVEEGLRFKLRLT